MDCDLTCSFAYFRGSFPCFCASAMTLSYSGLGAEAETGDSTRHGTDCAYAEPDHVSTQAIAVATTARSIFFLSFQRLLITFSCTCARVSVDVCTYVRIPSSAISSIDSAICALSTHFNKIIFNNPISSANAQRSAVPLINGQTFWVRLLGLVSVLSLDAASCAYRTGFHPRISSQPSASLFTKPFCGTTG